MGSRNINQHQPRRTLGSLANLHGSRLVLRVSSSRRLRILADRGTELSASLSRYGAL